METKDITEQQVLEASVRLFGNLAEESVDATEQKKLFEKLKDVEGFSDWLRASCSDVIKAYFYATTPMEQLTHRGAYNKLMYMRGLLAEAASTEKKPKLKNKRYT